MGLLAPRRPRVEAGHSIKKLIEHELEAFDGSPVNSEDLFGLAFSGGGIRSATFCLGVMQGLARHGWLRCFDYLSTVSGGGYAGAFWSAWQHRSPKAEEELAKQAEAAPVRHLREFSNYLNPRPGLFSSDTGRLITAPIAATVPSIIVVVAFIMLVLTVWSMLSWIVVGGGQLPLVPRWLNSGIFMMLLTGGALLVGELTWYEREAAADRVTRIAYYPIALLATVATAFAWGRVAPAQVPPFVFVGLPLFRNTSFGDVLILMSPAMAWGAALALVITLRALLSKWVKDAKHKQVRMAGDRVAARLIFLMVLCAAPALLWGAGQTSYGVFRLHFSGDLTWLGALMGSLTAAFVWVRNLIGRNPNKMLGDSWKAWLRPQLPKLLATAVVVLMFMSVSILLAYWQDHNLLLTAVSIAAAIVVVSLLTFHPNRLGLHSFYRSRLSRAYLGASNPETKRKRVTEEAVSDDLRLTALAGQRPVQLICCAANDLTPTEPLKTLNRGAVSAVLSPAGFSVGHKWKLWHKEETSVAVSAAITASAAAFNSMMGSYSKQLGPAVVFLMTTLNLRLGMWLQHPHAPTLKSKEWVLPGVLFFKELFGISNAARGDVHLSDGGHFENMAVYELLRRRCRYILACDCGADPHSEFNDLANLIRRAREDFGYEIEIDVTPLKPKDGLISAHFVRGTIQYDDDTSGVLLLLKPGLTGDEPIDLQQYRARNPDFPAETTGDQFYDEAQWESYRRLGLCVAEHAFGKPKLHPSMQARREALRRVFITRSRQPAMA